MTNIYKKSSLLIGCFTVLIFISVAGSTFAQIVTNGGFESSSTGIVSGADVKGWSLLVAQGVNPPPVFEIVNNTVEQGNRALKVTVHGLGANQWDIQVVADSIPVTPTAIYNYSVWAKAEKPGAQVNFTIGNYLYSEYMAIRPANLTTQWKKYAMQFKINDNQTYARAPIHFSYAADTGNVIYIDNLQITEINPGKKPVIVEAESGKLGSNFAVKQDNNITYVTAVNNNTAFVPGDSSRVATYEVTFLDSGYYNLFVHLRVGPNGYNDDSFFYGKGLGVKNYTSSTDWVLVNGLASAGFSDSTDFVDGPGSLGSGMWKWVNVTKNSYQSSSGDSFYVSMDSLTRTFQIGSREDGLDIDKFAFGKSNLYFTVDDLNRGLPGLTFLGTFWKGPALASGQDKFLGCSFHGPPDPDFKNYWTQLTPENAGKFGSVAISPDTSQWDWSGLDFAYNYAKNNHLIFKEHCLIWGSQQPAWLTNSGLDSAQQANAVETWIRKVGERYPKMDFVDVVNEAMPGHAPAPYRDALGGAGKTGWDWVIWAFKKARQYMPNSKLLLNDYYIINGYSLTPFIQLVDTLKIRGLIDGVGIQGHRDQWENFDTTTLRNNLDKLAETGVPIYISELDIGPGNIVNDSTQLAEYKRIFPMIWKNPDVKGITLWGYLEGQIAQTACYLVRSDGTARPALLWLNQYIQDNTTTGFNEVASALPSNYTLEQNFPNPFNPNTRIRYNIPATSKVTLKVFDILGREVKTLVNTIQPPGQYTVTFNAQNLSSGVYFYRIKAGNFVSTKKFVLLK